MRVLLLPFPAKAHVFSMVPLGWALRAAGHEVRFAARPNPAEERAFLDTGVDTTWVGDPQDLAAERRANPDDPLNPVVSRFQISQWRPEIVTPEYARGVYEMWVDTFRFLAQPSFLDDLVAFAEDWRADLVVWDPVMYAGPIAARAVGAADVRMLFAQDQWAAATSRHLGPSPADRLDTLATWLDAEMARHGAAFDESARYGALTVDPSPACLRYDVPVDYLPMRFTPFNGRSVVPDWVREPAPRRRVCLTLGVSNREVHGHEQASVAELLEGVADLDVEVVATFTAAQLAGAAVPDNVRAVDFVPLNELLPSCAAIVHQGGGGTIGNSVVHGVPQVIVPGTTWSEQSTAHAFEERGLGVALELPDLSAETLRESLRRVLEEPSFAVAAAEVRDEVRAAATPDEVVRRLEALVE